jgi:Uma2 family endonuclease
MSQLAYAQNYTSVEEYLEGELVSKVKHEYIDGEVFAMAGASRKHNLISGNIFREIGNKLKHNKSSCEIYSSDMKVKVSLSSTSFFYPDIMVVCDTDDEDEYYQNSPKLIIEILSKTTRKNDFTTKMMSYFNITSLEEYVLIEQDLCQVTVYKKTENWKSTAYFLGDKISFESIDTVVSVEDIYYQIKNDDISNFLIEKEQQEVEQEQS